MDDNISPVYVCWVSSSPELGDQVTSLCVMYSYQSALWGGGEELYFLIMHKSLNVGNRTRFVVFWYWKPLKLMQKTMSWPTLTHSKLKCWGCLAFVEQVATSVPDWFIEMKETTCWCTWQMISVAALSGALVDSKSWGGTNGQSWLLNIHTMVSTISTLVYLLDKNNYRYMHFFY